ncbi:MAG: HAD family hydrolase, partial [Dehalococcoidia bacterium]
MASKATWGCIKPETLWRPIDEAVLLMSETKAIRAVIFDMDGVLADSEPLYHLSLTQGLASRGYHLSQEHNRAILGTTVEYTWNWLKEHLGLQGNLDRIIAEYDSVVLKNLREKVVPSPGVYELLDGM